LDEIVARHIQPMTGYVRDIMSYKYFMDSHNSENIQAIEEYLRTEKKNQPQKIP